MDAIEISRSGMDVEWRRLEVIAENLANAGTTRPQGVAPYQSMRVVSGPRNDFANLAGMASGQKLAGVAVSGLEPVQTPGRRAYEPGHPHADAEGFVTYAGVDHVGEMTLMMKTSRSYEANLVALNIARQMYAKALELGRR